MKPLYAIKASDAKLHVSEGNEKIGDGIWSFSTLPGDSKHMLMLGSSALLTDIPGTCGKLCDGCFNHGCYAVKSAKLHHNAVIKAWAENTMLLRSGKLFAELDAFITKKNGKYLKTGALPDRRIKMFRINVSGEIQNAAEFKEWNLLACNHPEVIFSVYTKNFDALDEFMQEMGAPQDNFVINVSQWHHCADGILSKYPATFNIFEYDDSNVEGNGLSEDDVVRLSGMVHCPAVTKKGKHAKDPAGVPITCDRCIRCYRKGGSRTAVYAH